MLGLRGLILLSQVLIRAEPVKRKLTLNSILNICDNSESSFDAQSPTFQNLTRVSSVYLSTTEFDY